MEIKKLIAVATGEIHHIYNGLCPDSHTGPGSRDAECPACKILTDAAAKHDEMACRVRQVEALQHRIVELEAEVESSEEMKTLRFCEGEWATEREALVRRLREAENDTERLNFLERRQLEIDSSGGWNEDPTFGVTRVSGGRNDRKWTCLARGETLREAIDAAMQPSKGRQS